MLQQPKQTRLPRAQWLSRRAFTIVELLIVVTIIIILLSILIVAVNAAQRAAQKAKTDSVINAVSQAMVRFKEDVEYYPPVLDPYRNLPMSGGRPVVPHPADANYDVAIQDWYSITTLADYLLGYGNNQQDGFDGPGIRQPEADGVWSATINGTASGLLADRNLGAAARTVKVYGPYLELKDQRLLGSIDPANPNLVYFPGDAGYDPDAPKVIADYWGRPLRYYRPAYPPGGLKMNYRPGTAAFVPSLADVFVLRPFELKPGQAVDARMPDANGDTTCSFELKSAPFAIFSSGPDLGFTGNQRYDQVAGSLNQDNMVGLGQ